MLNLADWLITEAQLLTKEVRQPFARHGSISPTRFKPAIDQLNSAKQYLQELVGLLPEMLALPHEQALSKVQTGNWEIKKKIYAVITDADTLISLLEERQPSDRWEITKQSDNLVAKIPELASFFADDEASF